MPDFLLQQIAGSLQAACSREMKMHRKSIYEIFSQIAALILFLGWILQQWYVDGLDRKLSDLTAAENTYRVYQSHNAVFKAIIATQKDTSVASAIRRLQTYNYGLGLSQLAKQVGMAPLVGYDTTMDEMQKFLEQVQAQAGQTKQEIERKRSFADLLLKGSTTLGTVLVLWSNWRKLLLALKDMRRRRAGWIPSW
jgi:hypothetical protein